MCKYIWNLLVLVDPSLLYHTFLLGPARFTALRISALIFDEIRGVWIFDETLSRVFDISPQSKQKLRSKRRSKIVKIYAN